MIMQCENCGEMFEDTEGDHTVCTHSERVTPERQSNEVVFDPREEGTPLQRANVGALLING